MYYVIQHGIDWDCPRASAVTGRWQTAWAMAMRHFILLEFLSPSNAIISILLKNQVKSRHTWEQLLLGTLVDSDTFRLHNPGINILAMTIMPYVLYIATDNSKTAHIRTQCRSTECFCEFLSVLLPRFTPHPSAALLPTSQPLHAEEFCIILISITKFIIVIWYWQTVTLTL